MKKFLLITYYWPPAGGAGVQRWAKMSKYIRQYGWEPIIMTPSGGEVPVHDESLGKEIPPDIEVIRIPIWEPYDLYKTFLGRKKKEKLYSGFINEKKKASLAQKLSVFIRGNFFIPDARMFWIRPATAFLKRYVKDHRIDAIVSTGPPHSMHLIAEKIHRYSGIPWIADFRDPWTNIDFYRDLHLTSIADAIHKRLEKKVLRNATRIVTVTWRSRDEFKELCGRDDIVVIPNGFDHADFEDPATVTTDPGFTLMHAGSMNKDRNPRALWQALKEILPGADDLRKKLTIKLIGPVDFSVRASVDEFGLNEYTQFNAFIPHNEIVRMQQRTQVLLLIINNTPNSKTIIPGKLYEYLGSGRPVLMIGPGDSDSARVIGSTQAGAVHEFDDVAGIKETILIYFDRYQKGDLKGNASGIEKFTRKALAADFARVLDEVKQS